jgi:prevent-host-death family protein
MVTKLVGVRELKNQAPKLVQRAERGEEFVITRHGRAAAVLGPPALATASDRGRPRLEEWETERRAFERSKTKLLRRFRGKFVAIKGGAVIASHRDARVLFERVARALRSQTFFIGRVGDVDPVIDMPGFSFE